MSPDKMVKCDVVGIPGVDGKHRRLSTAGNRKKVKLFQFSAQPCWQRESNHLYRQTGPCPALPPPMLHRLFLQRSKLIKIYTAEYNRIPEHETINIHPLRRCSECKRSSKADSYQTNAVYVCSSLDFSYRGGNVPQPLGDAAIFPFS